jgi:signal transduction histidine kinase/HAMP domain-containing protein
MIEWLPRLVARVPARVSTKLVAAFLTIVVLLIVVGAVGLQVLSGVNRRADDLVSLQRKIAAYRQLQHDTTSQLYSVASALLIPEERTLAATLRQLNGFGYDLDRLQFIAKDEVALLGQVREEYGQFIQVVTQVVELMRSGQIAAARQLQLTRAGPFADRLERLTNELVNKAEADMVASIEAGQEAYRTSWWTVMALAMGSIGLALLLGYAISRSLTGPVMRIDARLREIASGEFSGRVQEANRDELGTLAANLNRMSEELGRLYRDLEARTAQLVRSVEQLKGLGEVSQTVSSTLDLRKVLTTIVAHAVKLSETDGGAIYEFDDLAQEFKLRATHGMSEELIRAIQGARVRMGESLVGQAALRRQAMQLADLSMEPADSVRELLQRLGFRALLAVPLVREEKVIGALVVRRRAAGNFALETVDLLQTFAAHTAVAIENAKLFEEIEDKSRQLEVANRHKSEFLTNMSHELRTPLNAVIGFSEVLLERMFGEVNEKQAEYLEDILSSGRHLLSLINDILDLSKIEAGRMELDLTRFDLPLALGNALTLVKDRAARHGVRLELAVDERLGELVGDERMIKQTVLNLLANAVKFTPEGGGVRVAAVPGDGAVEISVSDTGIGIAPEDQAAIFEEFRQVGTDSGRPREGTGLGLTLTKKFVELHGGQIWVKSEVGRGSTFTFTLPVRPWPAS